MAITAKSPSDAFQAWLYSYLTFKFWYSQSAKPFPFYSLFSPSWSFYNMDSLRCIFHLFFSSQRIMWPYILILKVLTENSYGFGNLATIWQKCNNFFSPRDLWRRLLILSLVFMWQNLLLEKSAILEYTNLFWLKSIEHTVSSTLSSYGDCSTAIYSVPGAIWKQWSFLVLRTSPDHLPFITTVLSPAHGLAALWLRSFSGVWNPPEICQDTLCPLTLLSVCLCCCCLSKLLSLLPPKCSSHSPCSQWSHELLWPWPRLGRAH